MAGAKRRQLKLEWPSRRVGTLFAVGSLLVALELLYESNAFFFMPYTNVFAKFVFHFFASVGEFLVIGATVAYLFSRVEQFEFMNNILDQRDVLTEVSNAGVVKMVPNPRDTMYEEELKNHEKIIICLRGSLSFFHLRQRLILDRLDDKKVIKVYCDSENIAVIEGWKLGNYILDVETGLADKGAVRRAKWKPAFATKPPMSTLARRTMALPFF